MRAESAAKDPLMNFAEAPLDVALEIDAEDVLELFEEEVLEAVPFEAELDTELVNVVPAEVVEGKVA